MRKVQRKVFLGKEIVFYSVSFLFCLICTVTKTNFFPFFYADFFSRSSKIAKPYFFMQKHHWNDLYESAARTDIFFMPHDRIFFRMMLFNRFIFCSGEDWSEKCQKELPRLLKSQLEWSNELICKKKIERYQGRSRNKEIKVLMLPANIKIDDYYEKEHMNHLEEQSLWSITLNDPKSADCKEYF